MKIINEIREDFKRVFGGLKLWEVLVMVAVLCTIIGLTLSGCAKRQNKLDKYVTDLQKLVHDISLSTCTMTIPPQTVITSSCTDIDQYVSYGDTRVEEVVKVSVHTETSTVTLGDDSYGSYGDSYGGGVPKPGKLEIRVVSVGSTLKAVPSKTGTAPAVAVATGTMAKPELSTGKKMYKLGAIVLIILMFAGLGIYIIKDKKSV